MEVHLNDRMISEAAGECSDLFHQFLSQSQLLRHGPASALVENQYDRFNIWTSDIGVFAPAQASIDYRLREAADIKDLVNRLLETLRDHIQQICGIITGTTTSSDRLHYDTAPFRESISNSEPLKQALAAVAKDISILHKLSNTIRKASAESHDNKAATNFEISDADGNNLGQLFKDEFATSLLKMKFPNAHENIRARLASAMLLRRKRILYRKSRHGARPIKILPKPIAAEIFKQPPELVETRLVSESKTEGSKSSQLRSTTSRVLSQAHTATNLDPESFRKASAPSRVSTPESIPLVHQDELNFPPMPRPVGDLEPVCPYCFLVLLGDEATDSRNWREHVKNDLDPYVCLFEICDQPDILYKHSQPWLKHMRQEHMLQWRCPAKSHKSEVFQTQAEFEDHMREHHRSTFSDKQLPRFAKRFARPNGPTFPSCPLCGLSETNTSRMESHVVQHLRFLALKSLPWPDDVEDTPSSKALGKSKTRTTVAELSEQGARPIFHDVPYDAPERPSDVSEIHKENNSLFEKSHWAMRTEQWSFVGGVPLGPSKKTSLDIISDPILKTLAEGSTEPEGTVRDGDIDAPGGDYGSTLEAASLEGHVEEVQILLDDGADVNAQGGYFGNALQAASCRGYTDEVHVLLDAGANINAQDGEFGNALQAASYRGHETVVRILLDKGADINAQGGYYGNALQAASWRGHGNVVQILLEKGAYINAQGGEYSNALQAASYRGHDSVVQILLEHGANVNAQGEEYSDALQVASCRGYDSVVQILLEHGANVNAQGGEYGNALQAASYRGHDNVVQMLLENGAEVEKLGVQVIETRKKVSGEEHPDTLTSTANLASIYKRQGGENVVLEKWKKQKSQDEPWTFISGRRAKKDLD